MDWSGSCHVIIGPPKQLFESLRVCSSWSHIKKASCYNAVISAQLLLFAVWFFKLMCIFLTGYSACNVYVWQHLEGVCIRLLSLDCQLCWAHMLSLLMCLPGRNACCLSSWLWNPRIWSWPNMPWQGYRYVSHWVYGVGGGGTEIHRPLWRGKNK